MRLRNSVKGAWIALAAAALDRASKEFAVRMAQGEAISLIPGVIRLRSVTNRGMAFSLLSGQTLLLTVLAAALTMGLAAWLIAGAQKQSKLLRAGLWLAVGGGAGNLYDRIAYGCVIDFIEPTFVRFAVFNLADVFVCAGVVLAAAALVWEERKKESVHE